jgi:hypothetical protein
MLRPIRFQCVEIWISAGLCMYTYLVDRVFTQFRHPRNYRFVPILGNVALSRVGSVTGAFVLFAVNASRWSEYTRRVQKKDRNFAIKTLFYNILSTVPFKVIPSTGDTPFPTFLLLLECFLERIFCDGAQFSYRIFLNLRVFKKKTPNFLNSLCTCLVQRM